MATGTMIPFGLRVVAEGEVRNSAGEIVDRPRSESVETVQVDLEDLRDAVTRRNLTDDDLRAIGIGDPIIDQIRSTQS